MSALVSPRGLASPSRSAKFSSAWREMQRPAQLISCPGTASLQGCSLLQVLLSLQEAAPSQHSNQQTPSSPILSL